VPDHPENQSDIIKNMLRDMGIRAMVDVANAHWSLPKLNSSGQRHSAAWFVGEIMELTERHVRRIYQEVAKMPPRLRKFLIGQ
jgi:hypothetical protein